MKEKEKEKNEKKEVREGKALKKVVEQPRFSMVKPVVSVEEALVVWQEYQNLKTKLADKGDFVKIKEKDHPTKQYANKLSKFFSLSVEILKAEKETKQDNSFVWHIWTRATAPNGQYRDGDGHCHSRERTFTHLEHDVYATAVTRSKNRAILELVGFGEVSAEEMMDSDKSKKEEKEVEREVLEKSPYADLGQDPEVPTANDKEMEEEYRKKLYAKIHATAEKLIPMPTDESLTKAEIKKARNEIYKQMLMDLTGKDSCVKMNVEELQKLHLHFLDLQAKYKKENEK